MPKSADIHHARGLSLVPQQRTEEITEELKQASKLNPQSERYIYVYAVALNSTGNTQQTVMVLQGAHNRFPNNSDILAARVAPHRDSGDLDAARIHADKFNALIP